MKQGTFGHNNPTCQHAQNHTQCNYNVCLHSVTWTCMLVLISSHCLSLLPVIQLALHKMAHIRLSFIPETNKIHSLHFTSNHFAPGLNSAFATRTLTPPFRSVRMPRPCCTPSCTLRQVFNTFLRTPFNLSRNKKLLGTSASLLVTSALLVQTRS